MPSIKWWISYVDCNHIATYFFYQKQTFLNRASIKGPHRIENITVPIVHRGKKQPYMNVEILYGNNEIRRILQTLRCAYGKTAYFIFYFGELETILNHRYRYLHQLNHKLIEWLAQKFYLEPPIFTNSSYDEIETWFSKNDAFTHKEYYQPFGNFVHNLSAIDLLMNLGPDAKKILSHN
ncbi:MAG: WbqC family protein [Bacteroidia bacterium]|nr:WbqC family protein [Bacteroidia bacterium]